MAECNTDCQTMIDHVEFEALWDMMDKKIRANLQEDYDCKKINGTTFADTWAKLMGSVTGQILGAMTTLATSETMADRALKTATTEEIALKSAREECMATAECTLKDAQKVEIGLKSLREECMATAECDLKQAQEDKAKYETSDILPAQKALTLRQTDGFDDNLRQKLFEAQMNAWAMMFSSGLLEAVPCFISSDEASTLYGGILTKTMPTYTENPQACCSGSGGLWSTTSGTCLPNNETSCNTIGGTWTPDALDPTTGTCSIISGP